MHEANVNGKKFEITLGPDGVSVNGKPLNWDLVEITDGYFHIIHENKGYRAEIVKIDRSTKVVTLKVNSQVFSVALKDKYDLLLEKMGMGGTAGNKINNIKAPMPGLIIDLKVKAGDVVKQGDPLLILEAMKMENIIKSPGDAIVKGVNVKKGDSVEKGQVLLEF